jgi:hypothetical protein
MSAVLRRRLERAAPGATIRAIVLLETPAPAGGRTGDRAAAIRAVRAAAAEAKRELDPLLARLGGYWLSDEPDALGSLGVDAPAATLLALAASDQVRTVLEDQAVSALPRPRR